MRKLCSKTSRYTNQTSGADDNEQTFPAFYDVTLEISLGYCLDFNLCSTEHKFKSMVEKLLLRYISIFTRLQNVGRTMVDLIHDVIFITVTMETCQHR